LPRRTIRHRRLLPTVLSSALIAGWLKQHDQMLAFASRSAPCPAARRVRPRLRHAPGTNPQASDAPFVVEAQSRTIVRQPAKDVALRKDLFRPSVTGRESACEFL